MKTTSTWCRLALTGAVLGFLHQPCSAGIAMTCDGIKVSLTGADWVLGTGVAPELRITKAPDSLSPRLLQKCGDGAAINRITLSWGGAAGVLCRLTVENAVVRALRTTVVQREKPEIVEQCEFAFQTVEWSWFGPDAAEVTAGGTGTRLDLGAMQVTPRTYLPFRATLTPVAGQRALKLTCPVQRGRTYRLSASDSLEGRWEKLEEFTAGEDGEIERQLPGDAVRLFLRVEVLD